MAKKVAILVCSLIISLDIAAGILGIQAEVSQHKVERSRLWISDCREPSHKASKLGLGAIILLCLAHSIANLFGGCVCNQSNDHEHEHEHEHEHSSSHNHLALMASLILSWITFVVAFSMLISRTLANSETKKDCGLIQYPLLSIGGVLCLVHGLFAVAYYISAHINDKEEKKLNQQVLASFHL